MLVGEKLTKITACKKQQHYVLSKHKILFVDKIQTPKLFYRLKNIYKQSRAGIKFPYN